MQSLVVVSNLRRAKKKSVLADRVDKALYSKNVASDGNLDNKWSNTCSEARDKHANTSVFPPSNNVTISSSAPKLPSRLRGVEKPIRPPFGARARKLFGLRKSERRKVPGTQMSSRIRHLLGILRQSSNAPH